MGQGYLLLTLAPTGRKETGNFGVRNGSEQTVAHGDCRRRHLKVCMTRRVSSPSAPGFRDRRTHLLLQLGRSTGIDPLERFPVIDQNISRHVYPAATRDDSRLRGGVMAT
jgi:hypothetical protein